jgi:hypothetical protein
MSEKLQKVLARVLATVLAVKSNLLLPRVA